MNNPNEVRCERERIIADYEYSGQRRSWETDDYVWWGNRSIKQMKTDAKRIAELEGCVAALRKDAERYRWLRDADMPSSKGGNRWPHVTQYPYCAEIDRFEVPQVFSLKGKNGANLDAAIDLAIEVLNSASDTPMAGKEKVG